MDNCNSASNQTTSSSGIPPLPPLEPDEYCASGDVTGTSSVPKPGDHCTGNYDLTNGQETCEWESSTNYGSISPEIGDCLAAYVSASDSFNVPDTGDCLAACASVDDTSEVCVSAIDTLDTPRTFNCLADWYVALRENPDIEDLPRVLIPYFEIIDATATNLVGRDFMDLAKTVRDIGKEHLSHYLSEKCTYVIKKCVEEYYGKEFNMEDYHYTIDALKKFSTNLKDCRGNSKIFFLEAPEIMAILKEKNLLTEEIWLIYIKMNMEKDDIQRRLTEFHYIDISGIAEYIKSLQETGLLSDILLSRFKFFVNESKESSMAFEFQLNRMKDIGKYIKDIQNPEKRLNYHFISEENAKVLKHCEIKAVSKVYERETNLKKADKESKSKICRLEHNTPFCGNCGWRSSWLKAFKKRGVYIKEATNGTKEHIWQIDINRD